MTRETWVKKVCYRKSVDGHRCQRCTFYKPNRYPLVRGADKCIRGLFNVGPNGVCNNWSGPELGIKEVRHE